MAFSVGMLSTCFFFVGDVQLPTTKRGRTSHRPGGKTRKNTTIFFCLSFLVLKTIVIDPKLRGLIRKSFPVYDAYAVGGGGCFWCQCARFYVTF